MHIDIGYSRKGSSGIVLFQHLSPFRVLSSFLFHVFLFISCSFSATSATLFVVVSCGHVISLSSCDLRVFVTSILVSHLFLPPPSLYLFLFVNLLFSHLLFARLFAFFTWPRVLLLASVYIAQAILTQNNTCR